MGDDVPALAWFLFSSLVPLALGLTALATVVLGDFSRAQSLAQQVSSVLPKDLHDQLVLILRTRRDLPLLIAGSIAVMVWTSSGAVGVMARCLSRLLALRGTGIVIGKLRNLAVAGGLATLLVLMVLVASAGTGILRQLGLDSTLTRIVVPMIEISLTLLICAGVYWRLAAGELSVRAALAGGVVAAVLLAVTPTAAGYYLRFVAGTTPVELFLILAGSCSPTRAALSAAAWRGG